MHQAAPSPVQRCMPTLYIKLLWETPMCTMLPLAIILAPEMEANRLHCAYVWSMSSGSIIEGLLCTHQALQPKKSYL